MGTGDGQDRGPSASGAPEPLLTKLKTSGTLGAEAEQKQAEDGRHQDTRWQKEPRGKGSGEGYRWRIPGHCWGPRGQR